MASRIGLGVDFGGTKLLGALVDLDSGEVLASAKKKSSAGDDSDEVVKRLFDIVDDTLKAGKMKASALAGIGVGIAGQVDADAGVLLAAPNLSQAAIDVPIVDMLAKRYKTPAVLRNDVQVAAAGELGHGAGRDVDSFLCCFVGTGVGGAVVIGGKLIGGASGSAGEIGHVIVQAGGRLCGCGGHGHLEAYASRTAITRAILGQLKLGRKSLLTELAPELDWSNPFVGGALRSGVLAKAVDAKDPLAVECIMEAGQYLGLGLASMVNLLNPQRIVLGGGVIEAVDLIFDVAVETVERESLAAPARAVEIVRAGLGDYSGVVGAALLAERHGRK